MIEHLYHLKRAAYFLTSLAAIVLTFMPSLADVPRLSRLFVTVLFWVSALCMLAAYEGVTTRADVLACCSSSVLIGTSVCTLIAAGRDWTLFYVSMGHSARLIIYQVWLFCGRGLWLVLLAWASFSFLMAAWFVLREHFKSMRFEACLEVLVPIRKQEGSRITGN